MSLPLNLSDLDDSQLEILDQRLSGGGLGAVQGPPGTGKSLLMAYEAAFAYALEIKPIVVAAYGNQTIDHVLRYTRALLSMGRMTRMEGELRSHICRVGYAPAISDDIRPFHTNRPREIMRSALIFTTLHSAWRIANRINAQRIIIDETAQARPEQVYIVLENALSLADTSDGVDLTVVGDHMQATPISSNRREVGILSRLAKSSPQRVAMLRTTYREPEPNVDMTSQIFYEGRLDAPFEVRGRRLPLPNRVSGWIGRVLDAEEPLTFVDARGPESQAGFGLSNTEQARLVEDLVKSYTVAGIDVRDPDRMMVVTPYRGQIIETRRRLEVAGLPGVKVTSITKALGLESDITVLQTVRSNLSGNIGMMGWTEILNVGTSRMRCKLIVIGNLETFAEGHVYDTRSNTQYTSRSRRVARFIESHGSVIQAPCTTP